MGATYDPYSMGLPGWAPNPFGGNTGYDAPPGFGGFGAAPAPNTTSTTPPFDWTKLGTLLAGAGNLFGGQGKGPEFKGYEWMKYPGAGGLPQMSEWSQEAYGNWQNLMAKRGLSGGYDPADTYKIFAGEVMPQLNVAAKEASKGYQQLLVDQARKMMQPAMENSFANLAGGSGSYSGYGMEQMQQAGTTLADQYSRAGAEAELGLLSNWGNIAEQQLGQNYQSMYQMFAEPMWVPPTAVPGMTPGKDQGWLARMLQGGMQGAGLGAGIGGMIPGGGIWGALLGGGLGAISSLLS